MMEWINFHWKLFSGNLHFRIDSKFAIKADGAIEILLLLWYTLGGYSELSYPMASFYCYRILRLFGSCPGEVTKSDIPCTTKMRRRERVRAYVWWNVARHQTKHILQRIKPAEFYPNRVQILILHEASPCLSSERAFLPSFWWYEAPNSEGKIFTLHSGALSSGVAACGAASPLFLCCRKSAI